MSPVSRRHFMQLTAGAAAVGFVLPSWAGAASACPPIPTAKPLSAFSPSAQDRKMAKRFLRWLRKSGLSRERDVRNLVFNFFDTKKKKGTWIYPMLSGKAIVWLLRQGKVNDAVSIGDSLLRWQQGSKQGPLAKSYGAFPSLIEKKAGVGWVRGDRYYSGDNLVILQAFVDLYQKTKNAEYLNAAIGMGTWLTEVMCKGHVAGLWAEDHGAPMQFVTASGDFSNQIHGAVEALWLRSLHDLGTMTNEPAYCKQVVKAYAFLRKGQHENGAYLDHYDPGFPAEKYDAGRWAPYQADQVISDNSVRAALAACRMGDIEAARKFYNWLHVENGAIPAYLSVKTGKHGFPTKGDVYYDITSSALHRSLCHWLGEDAAAKKDIAFLRKVQHSSGSWYWGLKRNRKTPPTRQLAPIVGFWATADLSLPSKPG